MPWRRISWTIRAFTEEDPMIVKDVMATRVVTVAPDASLKAVAALMAEHGVSGLPVVAAGRVRGVVSEADVLVKELGLLPGQGTLAVYSELESLELETKAQARTAGDAMTAPAVVIGSDRPIVDAARLMIEHGVNRLPVVDGERLVGIVTRADLVRAFTRTDNQLHEDVVAAVGAVPGAHPARVGVGVAGGVVTLTGEVETSEAAGRLVEVVAELPGVVSVVSSLRAGGASVSG
jgi:CBS domain-containing protein